MDHPIHTSEVLRDVRYEIRGQLANRALELEKRGYEIISLNIGNPGLFGFRTPETMRLAMIENLGQAEPYCHQKGIFPAREAVVMQQQDRGISGVSADEVFIGNGVSELIDLSLARPSPLMAGVPGTMSVAVRMLSYPTSRIYLDLSMTARGLLSLSIPTTRVALSMIARRCRPLPSWRSGISWWC
jgi:aspartate/methionine/tyrosine aminotransferase